ncbi:carbamoyltransferase HypF [Geomesophilobacter sediminis]|uniref:Carbamoyltransferase n=1 Tax=Geomesophilobacter sediminis TaxID=2798584 RepID=A0A8J7M2T9_9BACT|nr:carbamoyltransferase HypF [Geomesophilobacter sediminis]MBJ6727603.1 carbamoyltransferase HypF [Geomesophilobacter sediminis]
MAATGRTRVDVGGIVQGVGFRPFVYRLASRHRLGGWVRNTGHGVEIEVEGTDAARTAFCRALTEEAPPLAVISSVQTRELAPEGEEGFRILASESQASGAVVAEIPPDCDVCDDCLVELFDPANRRYHYPFINCTNCGPRFSIITGVPYDRPATTMAPFAMCPECLREYHDPADRRFHAQPNACPVCGPRLRLLSPDGAELEGDPVARAAAALRAGAVVAVKGTGGFHLAVDAGSAPAVAELRRRKKRDEKPFALMAPDLEAVRSFAHCSDAEGRLLSGVERPIVLLRKREGAPVSPLVAPGNGWFGVMLPSTPLQHLLLRCGPIPLVMTSGNVSDEPIIHRDAVALRRLTGIADLYLTHDREIHTRSDDSILRFMHGEPLLLRRSRGYVPRVLPLPAPQPSVLALGAELKGAVCLTRGKDAVLSQHLGDLKNPAALAGLEEAVAHLRRLLEVAPTLVAHDLHPDYLSSRLAQDMDLPKLAVQHHHAHLAACMADNRLDGETIGVIFDGTGYGPDGTVWGGEFLVGGYAGYTRAGHLSRVGMPGGDAAVREPYRMALSWLYRIHGAALFDRPHPLVDLVAPQQQSLFLAMLEKGINTPQTSSCGRLFDAVAALIGLRTSVHYEGQAAMELEALAEAGRSFAPYPYRIDGDPCFEVDFLPCLAAIDDDLAQGRSRADIARTFHRTVAEAVRASCGRIAAATGLTRVVLSGGVFQNRLLTEEVSELLQEGGLEVFRHRFVPPNDGGIALGQAAIAGYRAGVNGR